MALPKVYADFQNLDDENRLRLTCAGTTEDLRRQGISLRDGLVLTLAFLSPEWPWNVRVGANSPSL